ncbi:hypothetical protein KY385_02030 [Candidatus Parcubacteria bacterium]|nr:hypothetical protein [Candidatus Parcubacteria bacterium]
MKKIASLLIALAFTLVIIAPVSAQNNGTAGGVPPKREQARAKANERIEKIKTEVEERKATIKQDVCERRQQQLQKIMPRLSNGANSVKSSIDKVYERVQGFYEKGQLTVSNYDELNANVAAAKVKAEVSLEAIESFEFEIDCDNKSVGRQLDGYREIIKEARESLKAYRTELVHLIREMRSASAETSSNSESINSEDNSQQEETGGSSDE